LEAAFWDVLEQAARSRQMTLAGLVASVDATRDGTTPLASSLRILALRYALARSTEPPPINESSHDLTQ
jgi:predicted DNA-binding ribbon-helix-helix protein